MESGIGPNPRRWGGLWDALGRRMLPRTVDIPLRRREWVMRRVLSGLAVVFMALGLVFGAMAYGAQTAEPSSPAAGRKRADAFAKELVGPKTERFPFSFSYGGRPSFELLRGWTRSDSHAKLDANRTRHLAKFLDPRTGLEVRVESVGYHDFLTVEWTLYFRNTAEEPTPILEDIQALDVMWQRPAGAEYVLHHAVQAFRRDQCPADSLRLRLYDLDSNGTYRFIVLEGQSPAEATGNDLLTQGLPVSTPQRPGAVVLLYQRK